MRHDGGVSSTDQSQQGWRCASCGAEHVGLAVAFGTPAPAPWEWASPEERAAGELNADMCVLPGPDGSSFYLRGQLEIPVVDAEIDRFVWGVWVSLSEANMQITADHWQDPERASLAPMFGWLCTALDYEQPTVGLAAIVHTRHPRPDTLDRTRPDRFAPLGRRATRRHQPSSRG